MVMHETTVALKLQEAVQEAEDKRKGKRRRKNDKIMKNQKCPQRRTKGGNSRLE